MPASAYHHGDLKNALIQAGIEILAQEGVRGLSLRKAARQAGVSHAAPYAHFADKQALLAAISTTGHNLLAARLAAAVAAYPTDPLRQLAAAAWEYLDFAMQSPAHFKLTFSSSIEQEGDYPALVAATQQGFAALRAIIERCQFAGLVRPGPVDVIAVAAWSQIHGLAFLLLEGQVSHTVLEQHPLPELLHACLQQIVQVPLEPHILAEIISPAVLNRS
jgi:AcrR family transcriptional regulator